MDFRERAEHVAQKVFAVLEMTPTAEQAKRVADTLEREGIEIVLKERETVTSTVQASCGSATFGSHETPASSTKPKCGSGRWTRAAFGRRYLVPGTWYLVRR